MRLALDLITRQVVDPDDLVSPVTSIRVRRKEIIPLEVRLAEGGQPVKLEGGSVEIYLTAEGNFASLIASETGIAAVNSGTETLYRGELDLDESAVNNLFASGTTRQVAATMEVRAVTSSLSYRSEPVEVVIQNSYTA